MEKLKEVLDNIIEKNKYKEMLDREEIDKIEDTYPFNKTEYVISFLMAKKILSFEEYKKIRRDYIKRNKYLYLYEINAPRTFGETWAQSWLNKIVPELEKPNKKLDPNYKGEYDLWYKGIKIEVKASRAVKKEKGISLIKKAISSDSKSKFEMNFQQIKTNCCDVFVWIAVWTDKIEYWVLPNYDVINSQYYSNGQHRGNKGEGQLWIKDSNISEFNIFKTEEKDILNRIIEKGKLAKQRK